MKMSNAALRAAQLVLHSTTVLVWYLPPNQDTVIGYAVLPDETEDELPATEVQVTMVGTPVEGITCTLKRSSKGANLFWIMVRQGPGSVVYAWRDPHRVKHKFVAHADNEPDTATGRQSTSDRIRRLQMIWKLMNQFPRFERSYHTIDGVCKAVGNQQNLAFVALRLLEMLFEENNLSKHRTEEVIKELMTLDKRDRRLLHMLKEAGANEPDESTVAAILRGTARAIDY